MDKDRTTLGEQARDMWDAGEYKAFADAHGHKGAHATGTVTKWVVEVL